MSFEESVTMGDSTGSDNSSNSNSNSNQIELTGNDPNDKSRKRIRVACDTCRKKKIKCNGTFPCLNCIQTKNESNCHYSDRQIGRAHV